MIRRLALASLALATLAACSQPETEATETQARAAAAVPAGATDFVAGPAVTPAEVSVLIAGPDHVAALTALGAFTDQPSRWTTAMRGIALGEAEWLAIVPALDPITENSTAYDLYAAVHDALINNAAGALAMAQGDEDLGIQSLCTIEYIDAPASDYAAFYDAATPAVEAVSDPALADKKAACLTHLKARTGA
jgi:hypothetical protein